MTTESHTHIANFIWSICNLLRGPYKRNEYRKVILPLTVLRRFDCILAATKPAVLSEHAQIKAKGENIIRHRLSQITGVLPHVPDAWIDEEKTKIGYEIPLNRHFYQYEPPRPLEVISADIKNLEADILKLLKEVTA